MVRTSRGLSCKAGNTDEVVLGDPRNAYRHQWLRAGQGFENAALRSRDPSAIPYDAKVLSEARVIDTIRVSGIDLSRRQRVGDEEIPALAYYSTVIELLMCNMHPKSVPQEVRREVTYSSMFPIGLVPRHSDYDWWISSQSKMGMSCGETRISMLRATPG